MSASGQLAQTAPVRASAEMQKVRQAALPPASQPGVTCFIAILICLWVLIPIWFIASMALTTPEVALLSQGRAAVHPLLVRDDALLPEFAGHHPGDDHQHHRGDHHAPARRSSLRRLANAISRYFFPGRDFYRLSILAVRLPGRHPGDSAGGDLHQFRHLRQRLQPGAHAHGADTADNDPGHRQRLRQHSLRLEEAAQVYGYAVAGLSHGGAAARRAGHAAAAIFTLSASWNEVFAASILTVRNRTLPAQVLSTLSQFEPYQFAGAFFGDDPGDDLYLCHSAATCSTCGDRFLSKVRVREPQRRRLEVTQRFHEDDAVLWAFFTGCES